MGAVTGIVAGFVAVAGAVAIYRHLERRAREIASRVDDLRGRPFRSILDFERDPATGVYRSK